MKDLHGSKDRILVPNMFLRVFCISDCVETCHEVVKKIIAEVPFAKKLKAMRCVQSNTSLRFCGTFQTGYGPKSSHTN